VKIAIVGAGPAGLYLAILLKKADPRHEVTVLERNERGSSFGWGVVFSDQTLGNLRDADPESYTRITDNFAHWDDIDVHFRGEVITSGGHGFSGIGRVKLLEILENRAMELGADIRFGTDVSDDAALKERGLGDADLVVAADGVNSRLRMKYASAFRPDLDQRSARYIWLGTSHLFEAFTFIFVENEHGVFQVHAYRYDERNSAVIVECDDASWRKAGFDGMGADESVRECERMFAPWLDGHPMRSNAPHLRSPWLSFLRVSNDVWYHADGDVAPVVLIGDAAHTAHFSIGSGTKLAMEDSIALASILREEVDLAAALPRYQEARRIEALRLQNAARNSVEWFENVKRYVGLDPPQFAYSLLTRSQRVSHENLRLRDRGYLEGVERWFSSRAAAGEIVMPAKAGIQGSIPPMFTPFRLREMELANRIVVSPMDMYTSEDGTPNDFHLVHLGARALGGAGLVVTEMTCVSPDARITLGCTGMYRGEHADAWRRIVAFVHAHSPAKICLQLGHAGRKGSTRLMWDGMDEPLDEGGWDVLAPSPVPWAAANPLPRAMDRDDMIRVRDDFVRATRMAADLDFDMIELHCAHGYLLSSFLTPLSNCREDEYGGSLDNRLRYPLEIFKAMREVWPSGRPMSVRISATDWVAEGISGDDAVAIARAFRDAGVDIIHVSAGQTSTEARPVYGRMFQTPLSDRIRNETPVPTIAVGNITDPDQVNAIIAAGRADLCAMARPHLGDPNWTQRAAASLGYTEQWWPLQYDAGKRQLERGFERQREMEMMNER
jgi:anthraniloyl-CoA monooxygenase